VLVLSLSNPVGQVKSAANVVIYLRVTELLNRCSGVRFVVMFVMQTSMLVVLYDEGFWKHVLLKRVTHRLQVV
jgi:hypothetical protein